MTCGTPWTLSRDRKARSGAWLAGEELNERRILTALVAALFHDTGHIQEKEDNEGTGAKYTANHVRRSMEFFLRHGKEQGLSEQELAEGRTMILCTDIRVEITASLFSSSSVELSEGFSTLQTCSPDGRPHLP